jgi:hypothetical protein
MFRRASVSSSRMTYFTCASIVSRRKMPPWHPVPSTNGPALFPTRAARRLATCCSASYVLVCFQRFLRAALLSGGQL